ncbi:MAG: flagellar motor switch protein FliN [Proteobacteria bacterium]|nr:flagellar motor switch protein FliN [Pseudomonadota bacterium]
MSEEVDPFEAAMAAMDGDNESEGGDDLNLDDLESALGEGEATETPAEDAPATPSADPFDQAMAAMDAVASDDTGIETPDAKADPFEAALEIAKPKEGAPVKAPKEKYFEDQQIDIDFLMDIKLNITFEVGRTKMFISDLLSLGQGSVIELHRLVGEELDLFINGELLATGEVVVVNEKFGARIVQILSPEDRINRLAPTLKK